MPIESVMPSSHLILCRPLLLLPPIPPSIRVFSNVPALLIRWTKYWSFSFSLSPSNEHSGLISFRMDWLDLLSPALDTQNHSRDIHLSQDLYDPIVIQVTFLCRIFCFAYLFLTALSLCYCTWAFSNAASRDISLFVVWGLVLHRNTWKMWINYSIITSAIRIWFATLGIILMSITVIILPVPGFRKRTSMWGRTLPPKC